LYPAEFRRKVLGFALEGNEGLLKSSDITLHLAVEGTSLGKGKLVPLLAPGAQRVPGN